MIHASRLRRRGKALDYLLPQRQQFSRKKGNTRTSRATLKTVLALSAPFALYGLHAFASGDDTTVTQGRKLAGSVAEGACDEWQNGENHTGTVRLLGPSCGMHIAHHSTFALCDFLFCLA